MVNSLRAKALLAGLVLLGACLSLPARAADDAAATVETPVAAEEALAQVPMPKARPAVTPRRIAATAPIRGLSPRDAYRYVARYERVAARWHMLFLGVGY